MATIGVQFYWNYKNYEENKQRVTNDIQLSFDTAIEEYYASLAKSNYVTIINSDNASLNTKTNNKIDSIKLKKPSFTINSIKFSSTEELSQEEIDSLMISTKDLIESTNRKIDTTASFTQFFEKKKEKNFIKNVTIKK